MDAQRIAVDAVVALTDCDREQVTAFIRRLYLAGVKDPKRLTFKGLQAWRGAEGGASPLTPVYATTPAIDLRKPSISACSWWLSPPSALPMTYWLEAAPSGWRLG